MQKISNIQNAHCVNKHHICCFKHCLQMFMHIISVKCGPDGIIDALYTKRSANWRSIEVPVLLKWQGTTEQRGWSVLHRRQDAKKSRVRDFKNISAPKADMMLIFSVRIGENSWVFFVILYCETRLKNKWLTSKILSCLSINLHLTKIKWFYIVKAIWRRIHIYIKKYFCLHRGVWATLTPSL